MWHAVEHNLSCRNTWMPNMNGGIMWKVIIIIVSILVFIGCDKGNVVGPPPRGAFAYKAYDSTGTLLVKGWFTLEIKDSAHISGEWHFEKVGDPQNIGPHSGDGQLVAGFDQGLLWANLNPKYVDNNVFLSGSFNVSTYDGTWIWTGYPGELNRGTFQAAGY